MHKRFIFFTLILGLFIAAASAPSPLYNVFQADWHFSAITLTLVFAVYALALLLALLFFGSLSDYIGRKPVLIAALSIEIVSMVVSAFALNVEWLLVARVLQGIATGLATAVLNAALLDTQSPRRPGSAALASMVVSMSGLGVGAITSGLLVDYAPWPTHLIFLILCGVMLIVVLLVCVATETATLQPGWKQSLFPTIAFPTQARKPLLTAGPSLAASWALVGLYLSLGPSLAAYILREHSSLVESLIILAFTATGATTAFLLRHRSTPQLLLAGAIVATIGVVVTAVGISTTLPMAFFAGTVIAGAGAGLTFVSALRHILSKASSDQRAGLAATVYIISYFALGFPVIIAGAAITKVGLSHAAFAYAFVVIALYVATIALSRFRRFTSTE